MEDVEPTTTAEEHDAPPRGGARRAGPARHPAGTATLAAVELWERFSFYGLQVILAYYIYYSATDGGLGLSVADGLAIAGAYGGGVYVLQPIGAWAADRLLSARRVVLVGAVLILLGHMVLAVLPGLAGLAGGLALIVVGTSALFPNILAIMGDVYAGDPDRRDAGFSLFYTAILVGALVGPLVTGLLQEHLGFHVAFAAAAVGMLAGLLTLLRRRSTLPASSAEVPNPLSPHRRRRALVVSGMGLVLIGAAVALQWITLSNINTIILVASVVLSVVYIVRMATSPRTEAVERAQVARFAVLFALGVLFYTLVLQLFTTFAVYADTRVDLSLGPFEVPAAYISTFQVVTGIAMGPVLALLWGKLGRRQPGGPVKLAMGLGAMALAFALFAVLPTAWDGMVPLVPVILGMALHGVAEILFAPVSMSVATQLAPRAFHAQTMAIWGMAIGTGASLSGMVSRLYSEEHEVVYFGTTALVAATAAALLLLFGRRLRTTT